MECHNGHTLRLHVYKWYLHWAPNSIDMTYIGLFGALGIGFRVKGLAFRDCLGFLV